MGRRALGNYRLRSATPRKPFAQRFKDAGRTSIQWVRGHLTLTAAIAISVFLIKTERDREIQIKDEQANLSVTGPVNYPVPNQPYVPRVGIYNGGKTTAFGVGGEIFVATGPPGSLAPGFDAEGYKSHHLIDIPARHGQFHSQALVPPEVGTDAQRLQIQNELLSEAAASKRIIWIYGGANYTTEFGDKGWVSYCFLLQPNLEDVFTCPGNLNQTRVNSKTWFQTLVSALPKWSSKDH